MVYLRGGVGTVQHGLLTGWGRDCSAWSTTYRVYLQGRVGTVQHGLGTVTWSTYRVG